MSRRTARSAVAGLSSIIHKKEGNLLTVTWEAQDAANGKEIVVETEIAELYSQEERLAVKTAWIIDRLRCNFAIAGAAV